MDVNEPSDDVTQFSRRRQLPFANACESVITCHDVCEVLVMSAKAKVNSTFALHVRKLKQKKKRRMPKCTPKPRAGPSSIAMDIDPTSTRNGKTGVSRLNPRRHLPTNLQVNKNFIEKLQKRTGQMLDWVATSTTPQGRLLVKSTNQIGLSPKIRCFVAMHESEVTNLLPAIEKDTKFPSLTVLAPQTGKVPNTLRNLGFELNGLLHHGERPFNIPLPFLPRYAIYTRHQDTPQQEPVVPFQTSTLKFVTVEPIYDIPTRILFDGAAGGTAFIDQEHARVCGLRPHNTPQKVKLRGIGSHSDDTSTFVEVPLRLNGVKFPVMAAVVKNLPYPMILGQPFLELNNATQDFTNLAIHFKKPNGQRVTLSMAPPPPTEIPKATPETLVAPITLIDAHEAATDLIRNRVEDSWLLLIKPEPDTVVPSKPSLWEQIEKSIPGTSDPELQMRNLLLQYQHLFPKELPNELPPIREGFSTAIDLQPGAMPIRRPMFRYSPAEKEAMETQVSEMLQKGLIEPSTAPFCAPVLFVRKKDGTLRMCIDYRGLNKITVRNAYPLPRIDDLFDKLQGATTFSSLDLLSGYYQLRLHPDDVPKTAFRTPTGLYQYRVLPMGLTNAPSVFMAAMNRVLHGLPFAVVYLDDILIFSKSPEEHVRHVEEVLRRLDRDKFFAKLSKCDFFQTSIKFLGHIVSAGGISPDPDKVKVIHDWKTPTNVREVRSFLGLANYFRKFVEHYSELATPLVNLTRGNVSSRKSKFTSIIWDEACQDAFDRIKAALTNAPVLALPDFTRPFVLTTDASGHTIGAILLQDGRPIAYESKKLTPAEMNFHTPDRELLAVIHALKIWRCYLEGPKFTIVTDHHPLIHLGSQPQLSRRQARWSEYLQGFNFDWVYKPGVTNIADPLTRLPGSEQGDDPPQVLAINVSRRHRVVPPGATYANADTIKEACLTGYKDDPWFQNPRNTEKLEYHNGLLFKGPLLLVPAIPALRESLLKSAHHPPLVGHGGVGKTLYYLTRHFWWPNIKKDVRHFVRACPSCQAVKARRQTLSTSLLPLPIPDKRWWTVTMDFITDLPTSPSGHDAILVFVDKLTKMAHFAPTTKTCDALGAAKLLITNVVRLHGVPRALVSDRDPRFRAALFQHFTNTLQITHGFSTAYHPQTDGQTERVNQVLEDYLRHYINPAQSNWEDLLPMAEFAYNNSFHTAIQSTPFLLNYGVEPLTPLTLLSDDALTRRAHLRKDGVALTFPERMQHALSEAKRCLLAAQQRDKAAANKRRNDREFHVGDQVLLSTANLRLKTGTRKLLPRYIGPFTITKRINRAAYQLHLPDSLKIHNVFYISNLVPFFPSSNAPPPLPDVIDGSPEWEVDHIIAHELRSQGAKRAKQRWYLIRWKGYAPEFDTWEPEKNLKNCPDILREYLQSHP